MIIVTGHMGFVGTHLVRELEARGEQVYGLDLEDGKDICREDMPTGADRLYHLAAQTKALSRDVFYDMRTNIIGTLRMLDQYGDKVVLASTSMVNYPRTPYAISKRACEEYARLHGAAIVRMCNLFGEGGHSVVDRFRQEDVLTIRGDGTQRRTYAPVENAIAALLAAKPRTLAVLTGTDMTVLEVAARHPEKRCEFVEADPLDIIDGCQRT